MANIYREYMDKSNCEPSTKRFKNDGIDEIEESSSFEFSAFSNLLEEQSEFHSNPNSRSNDVSDSGRVPLVKWVSTNALHLGSKLEENICNFTPFFTSTPITIPQPISEQTERISVSAPLPDSKIWMAEDRMLVD